MTSAEGRTIATLLDPGGRVREVARPAILDLEYGYDDHGRLSSLIQGARVHTLGYHSTSSEKKGYLASVLNAGAI